MSDFDAVLERLLTDPAFAAALAADPAAALTGYRLDPDEVRLLHTQVGADPRAQRTVETRANQSSLFGMLGPLAGMIGAFGEHLGSGDPGRGPTQGLGPAADAAEGLGPAADAAEGLGPAADAAAQGFGPAADASESVGPAGDAAEGMGPAADEGGRPSAAVPPDPSPPEGYRTRVDVDGDGRWDRHTLRGRVDGGVEILVDADHDGRVDFTGHDDDADGLVDSADYDQNHDGTLDKRMYDDNGDGWMDRSSTTGVTGTEATRRGRLK